MPRSYFAPTTDDYTVFYERIDPDMICNGRTVIVSFDESGLVADAKYRLYKPDNMVNPMEELIDWFYLSAGEAEQLFRGDNIAYFDITDCYDLRHNQYEGVRGDYLSKQEILDSYVDDNLMKMPCESWSDGYGMFISK